MPDDNQNYREVYKDISSDQDTGFKSLLRNLNPKSILWIMVAVMFFLYLLNLNGQQIKKEYYIGIAVGTVILIALISSRKEGFLNQKQIRSFLIKELLWYQKNPGEVCNIPEGRVALDIYTSRIPNPEAMQYPLEWETDFFVENPRSKYKKFFVARSDPITGECVGIRDGKNKGQIIRFRWLVPERYKLEREFWKNPQSPNF
ncbi:MAG: hypothetical protein AABY22_14260 [Nanoarchaeota archaeon]